jgi:hypothetical protein
MPAQRWFDKAGEGRLNADRRGLLALEDHCSHQAHRKRKLYVVVAAFVALDEFFQRHCAEVGRHGNCSAVVPVR